MKLIVPSMTRYGTTIHKRIQKCLVMNISSKKIMIILVCDYYHNLFNSNIFIDFCRVTSNEILGISSGIDDLKGLRMDLVICLFICWVIVFACLYNGLKSLGKVRFCFVFLVRFISFFVYKCFFPTLVILFYSTVSLHCIDYTVGEMCHIRRSKQRNHFLYYT